MSEKILTQEEINALLGGGFGREAPAAAWDEAAAQSAPEVEERRPVAVGANIFPMMKPQRLCNDRRNTLNLVFDTFTREGESLLAAALRTQIKLNLATVEPLSYREFSEGLPEPSSVWSLRLDPLELGVALCLEPQLVHAMVDLLMGGEGAIPSSPRPLTELDQSVIESVVEIFSRQFQKAWERILSFESQVEANETRPSLLGLYQAGEPMIQATLGLRIAQVQGRILWGLPASMLVKFKDRVESQTRLRSGQNAGQASMLLEMAAKNFPTRLEAVVHGSAIRVSELTNLSKGDVLRLDHPVDRPVEVTVNGVGKYEGQLVLSHGRRAVQIV